MSVVLENEIMNEIKYEFLNMAKDGHVGYTISLETACKWLDIKYNLDYRKNFKARVLKDSDYRFDEAFVESDRSCEYIIRKEGQKEVPYFSNDGFKLFCLISKSPKAWLVRKYFVEIEKEYVSMLKMTIGEFDEYKTKTVEEMNKFKEENGDLTQRLKRSHDKFEEMSQRRYIEYSTNLKLLKEHRQIDTYKYHINQLKKADSDPNLAREIAIDAYQTQYGKPLVMYLVDHKHIEELLVKALNKGRKKDTKVELEELREDYDLPTYANYDIDFESLSPMRIKHYIANSANAVDDELMYFVFGKFGSKALKQSEHIKTWTTLYFINDQHYREFVKSIDEFQLSNLVEVKDKTISKTYIAASCEILLKHASALGGVAWAFVNKKPSTAEPAGQADSDEDVI